MLVAFTADNVPAIMVALATLLTAMAGLLNSIRNGKKIAAVADKTNTITQRIGHIVRSRRATSLGGPRKAQGKDPGGKPPTDPTKRP